MNIKKLLNNLKKNYIMNKKNKIINNLYINQQIKCKL